MNLFFTMLVPLIIAGVALYGMSRRVDVYNALVTGAAGGLKILLFFVQFFKKIWRMCQIRLSGMVRDNVRENELCV